MAGVFINYRRDDCAGHAGRLYDSLVARLGDAAVFIDIDAIEPGADFSQRIEEAVGACHLLIVLIGDDWLEIADAHGRRRLDDPADLVRLEIAAGLRRSGLRVIPVLVEKATMPAAEQLPDDLKPLAGRNALELSDERWRYDVDRLGEIVESVSAKAPLPTGTRGVLAGRAERLMGSLRGRRQTRVRAIALAALAIAVGVAITQAGGSGDRAIVRPVRLGGLPGRPAVGNGAVWVPLSEKNAVARVNPAKPRATPDLFKVGTYPVAVAAGAGRIWVANASSDDVSVIDPSGRREVTTVRHVGHEPSDIAVDGDGIVWVANCWCTDDSGRPSTVARIDPGTGKVRQITVGKHPLGLGVGPGDRNVWVTSDDDGSVRPINRDTLRVGRRIQVGVNPTDVVVDSTGIWVSLTGENRVARIDPRTHVLDPRQFPVGVRPWTLALGGGFLWVSHEGDGSLRRIDPTHRDLVGRAQFLGRVTPEQDSPEGDGVAYGAGHAWLASRRLGTLRGVTP